MNLNVELIKIQWFCLLVLYSLALTSFASTFLMPVKSEIPPFQFNLSSSSHVRYTCMLQMRHYVHLERLSVSFITDTRPSLPCSFWQAQEILWNIVRLCKVAKWLNFIPGILLNVFAHYGVILNFLRTLFFSLSNCMLMKTWQSGFFMTWIRVNGGGRHRYIFNFIFFWLTSSWISLFHI